MSTVWRLGSFGPTDTQSGRRTTSSKMNLSPTPEPVGPRLSLQPDRSTPVSPAPVVHLGDSRGALLVDYPHGNGRIVILSDPYIFSNGGLSLRDNLQLALNLLTATEGLIAFDEYHQGKGTTRNALIGYFSGTPILPIVGQLVALILVILVDQ